MKPSGNWQQVIRMPLYIGKRICKKLQKTKFTSGRDLRSNKKGIIGRIRVVNWPPGLNHYPKILARHCFKEVNGLEKTGKRSLAQKTRLMFLEIILRYTTYLRVSHQARIKPKFFIQVRPKLRPNPNRTQNYPPESQLWDELLDHVEKSDPKFVQKPL